MQQRSVFPADQLGIPYTLYVPEEELLTEKCDDHHLCAQRKALTRRKGSMEWALRYSRVQVVPVKRHIEFTNIYNTTELLPRKIEKFGMLMLMIAGYLGDKSVDMSAKDHLVDLSLERRQTMWRNKEISVRNPQGIKGVMLDYVVTRDISSIGEVDIEEFIYTSNDERRQELGRKFFKAAAEVAIEPISQDYIKAWKSGNLPRHDFRDGSPYRQMSISKIKAVPKSPHKFVQKHLPENKKSLLEAIEKMRGNLESIYEAA